MYNTWAFALVPGAELITHMFGPAAFLLDHQRQEGRWAVSRLSLQLANPSSPKQPAIQQGTVRRPYDTVGRQE
jgi:hypothetical protein